MPANVSTSRATDWRAPWGRPEHRSSTVRSPSRLVNSDSTSS
ncbi:hypothetical protein ACFQV2_14780 [Actinokineospora soli]|uniref:Uncharacterized protein n=1 Tax=Actinokineospora soli TaxID=1048753 RepID=A0ABW2TLR8_9PSEU